MIHTPPIVELVPLFRCPHCEGRPRLYVHRMMARGTRYFRCKECDYRHKIGPAQIYVCGSPSHPVSTR